MGKKTYTFKLNYYDDVGKRRGKTFSAPTLREARLKAARWELDNREEKRPSMTVMKAVETYVASRAPVLSPSTIRMYESIQNRKIKPDPIGNIPLSELSAIQVQAWVNDQISSGSGAKTVKNAFGLLSSAVHAADKRIDLSDVRLPAVPRYRAATPDDDQVSALISWLRENDPEMHLAVLLAAFGPMRRSEICALTPKDVSGAKVTVTRAMVPGPGGEWIIKDTPKTDASNRTIIFPDFMKPLLKCTEERLIMTTPDNLSHRFADDVAAAGLPHFRFHDLRHYAASIMHANGVPDVYIIKRGGWSSDHVMKRIYRDALDAEMRKQTEAINAHFSQLAEANEAKSEAKIAITTL